MLPNKISPLLGSSLGAGLGLGYSALFNTPIIPSALVGAGAGLGGSTLYNAYKDNSIGEKYYEEISKRKENMEETEGKLVDKATASNKELNRIKNIFDFAPELASDPSPANTAIAEKARDLKANKIKNEIALIRQKLQQNQNNYNQYSMFDNDSQLLNKNLALSALLGGGLGAYLGNDTGAMLGGALAGAGLYQGVTDPQKARLLEAMGRS